MRLPWQRVKHTPLEHILTDHPDTLKQLSDHDLYRYVGGWKEGSAQHLAGTAEIRRREGKLPLYISVLSLLVAAIALFT